MQEKKIIRESYPLNGDINSSHDKGRYDWGDLTDQEFWDTRDYYGSEPSPNPQLISLFEGYLPKRTDWSAIEIGACPGNVLLTLARSKGYQPVALDFLPAVHRLPDAFRKHGVSNLEVIQQDFFKLSEDRHFNVVMSFGFIEHFSDAEAVLRKHWTLVEKNGYLVLSLPIFGPMQLALRHLILKPERLTESLQAHNRSIMDMRLFRRWSEQLPGAVILKCCYFGHMHTSYSSSDPFVRWDRRAIVRCWKLAGYIPRILNVSCRLFSPYGLLILRKCQT